MGCLRDTGSRRSQAVERFQWNGSRTHSVRAQRENQLPGLGIHRDSVGPVTQKSARHFRKKLNPGRAWVSHENAGVFFRESLFRALFYNEQIVGQHAISSVKKTGGQSGLPEATFTQKRNRFAVYHYGGGV